MKFLRTVSTRRLLALIAGLVIVVGGGTAIAVAAAGPGPVPTPKPLAAALHDALKAPQVAGITANISFTNNLIGSADLAGGQGPSDPILTGATGRLCRGSGHRIRLELQSDNCDAQVVVNNGSFWISDPSSHTVYEGSLPADHSGAAKPASAKPDAHQGLPTIAEIQSDLNKLMKHVDVSGATPGDVAGQAAYTVSIAPKHDGGLLGQAEVAWDAVRGVPLRIAIYARGNSTPVLELKATDISYGQVPASDFNVSPPAGSKVVKIATASGHANGMGSAAKLHRLGKRAHSQRVNGVAAVAAKLPFKLVAPKSLVGLPRHTVTLLDWGGKPAALVAYGQNLGGIAVIEQTQVAKDAGSGKASAGSGQSALSLPTVSINGASGQELDTALGTMVRFSRGGVSYMVLGSVPSAAADAAARAL
ncbi:MAG: LolA family protein [Solirubrobacteraceae bacterium]